jgi:hypothetical protein
LCRRRTACFGNEGFSISQGVQQTHLQHLEENKIVIPPYTYLQDTICKVLQQEQRRLIEFAKAQLSPEDVAILNKLLQNPQGLYEITHLKRSPKDFGSREMKREIKCGEQIYQTTFRPN